MLSKSINEALFVCNLLMHQKISELLPDDDSRLANAMRYSCVSEGKRIRPFLTIVVSQMFGVSPALSAHTASALEFIHTYSLIHDDLPAMDDDDFRRGKPSCHKQFDEATAILAGDALLTYAFEILSDPKTHKDAAVRCELISIISAAAGFKGMVGGQMMDLEMSKIGGEEVSKEKIARLHRLKTGEMFIASCEAGAILGRATPDERSSLRYYASDIGLAFQIRDDILDYRGIELGKAESKQDGKKEASGIVNAIGLDAAVKQLFLLKDQAISHLKIFGERAALLRELAEFIVNREK